MNQDYLAQARFWAGEYRRRLPLTLARAIPPRVNTSVVHALEARARPRDLTLGTTLQRASEITRGTHVLSDSATLVCPAVPALSAEDGFWFPAVTVYELTGIQLDVDSGLVFSRNWVVNGSGSGQRWAIDTAFLTGASVRVRDGARRPEQRPVAALGNAVEHYHFLMETLPQVLRIRSVDPDVVFVASSDVSSFARQRLAELDVALELRPRHQVLDCRHAYLCPGFPRERTHPADLDLLARTYAPGTVPGEGTRRLYVSRRVSLRPLKQEARLEDWLRARGFDIVLLEEMPFADQVACMAEAAVVVGPHGAGLANTVFMPRGGRVVELATTEWWSNAFRRIAVARGHDYTLVPMATTPAARWGSADEAIALLDPLLS